MTPNIDKSPSESFLTRRSASESCAWIGLMPAASLSLPTMKPYRLLPALLLGVSTLLVARPVDRDEAKPPALGATADLNTLTATVAGTGSPAQFSASGCQGGGAAGYRVTLCYSSAVTPAQRAAFEAAAGRWQGLVTGDLPGVAVNQPPGFCTSGSPGLNLSVDDEWVTHVVAHEKLGAVRAAAARLNNVAPQIQTMVFPDAGHALITVQERAVRGYMARRKAPRVSSRA